MAKETKVSENGKVDIHSHDPAYIVYKIGIYGWRKRCLYFLILLVLIMAIINLALTIWIIRIQDFSFSGMGKLHITDDGVKMDGTAEFLAALKAKTIKSRDNSPIGINSRTNISLSVVDKHDKVQGQISLDSRQLILKNNELLIQTMNGDTLLQANDKKIKLNIDNLDITVPGGLNLQSSVQTSSVKSDGNNDLHLESLTRKLYMIAPEALNLKSFGGDIKLQSLHDTKLVSKRGKIVLDGHTIQLKNMRTVVPVVPLKKNQVHNGMAEVCMCKDGTLFLAYPDSMNPCKVTAGVCDQ